jgi:prohibitin 2
MYILIIATAIALAIAGAVYVLFEKSKWGIVLGALFLGVVIAFESFTIVPAGHVGVQVTMGKTNLDQALPEGVNFVNPISNVRAVNVQLQKATLTNQSAGTKDMQQVHTDLVVNFRLKPNMVPTIYKEFGLNVDEKVLGPAIGEAFKSVTGHYTSEDLILKREEVSAEILKRLQEKVAQFDITVSNISLVNFGFSKSYQDAIDAKMIATQSKLKAEQDLQRITIEAKSRIAEAEGEAKAIAIQAQAINSQGGAAFVQLEAIKKWDGNLPNVMSGAMPFINVTGK